LAVAKKQARKATDRNRLKRIIREAFRNRRDALPAIDCVVMIRARAVSAQSRELAVALGRLLDKAREDSSR
jgi:ribonuclease P protein component